MNKLVIRILSINEVKKNNDYLLSYISPIRKEKALRCLDEEKQYQSIGAGYFLKKYTSGEESFTYNEYGKPLSEKGYFNIAHSHEYIVFTKTDIPCGIDIEKIRSYKEKLISYAFNIEDQKLIKAQGDFFKYWTLKEALGKACGNGLIDEDIKAIPAIEGKIEYQGKTYHSKALLFLDYYISVSLEGKLPSEIELYIEFIR